MPEVTEQEAYTRGFEAAKKRAVELLNPLIKGAPTHEEAIAIALCQALIENMNSSASKAVN